MYYLLVAAAVALTGPVQENDLTKLNVSGIQAEQFSSEDAQRIRYNVRKWEQEMDADTVVFVNTYETLDACKAQRAKIRVAMRDSGLSNALRSNCYKVQKDSDKQELASE